METTEEKSLIISDIESSNVEKETAISLKDRFLPFENQAREWMENAKGLIVTDASQVEEMARAREARLQLRSIRIAIDKTHKELKEDSLNKGKILDKVKRTLLGFIEPIEGHLQNQEDFIKIKEQEEREQLQASRVELLLPYMGEMVRSLSLTDLNEDAFNNLLNGQKLAYEAKIQADKDAEEKRLQDQQAKEIEDKRIREENEKLQIEKNKLETKLKVERDAKRKLEAEQLEREEKEESERKAKQAAEKKLKRGPDKDKLLAFSKQIGALVPPQVKDEESQKIVDNAMQLLLKVERYIDSNAEKL